MQVDLAKTLQLHHHIRTGLTTFARYVHLQPENNKSYGVNKLPINSTVISLCQ